MRGTNHVGKVRVDELEGLELRGISIEPEHALDVERVATRPRGREGHPDQMLVAGRSSELEAMRRREGIGEEHIGVRGIIRRPDVVGDDITLVRQLVGRQAVKRVSRRVGRRRDVLRANDAPSRVEHAFVLDPIGDERRVVRGQLRAEHGLSCFVPHARDHHARVGAHSARLLVAYVDRGQHDGVATKQDAHAHGVTCADVDGWRDGGPETDSQHTHVVPSGTRQTQHELASRVRQRSGRGGAYAIARHDDGARQPRHAVGQLDGPSNHLRAQRRVKRDNKERGRRDAREVQDYAPPSLVHTKIAPHP